MDLIWFLIAGLGATWPLFLFSGVSALALGVLQRLVVARGHWAFWGAIPLITAVVWFAAFSISGLVGNLGGLFVFGPSMVLWPAAVCIGHIMGLADKQKGGKE